MTEANNFITWPKLFLYGDSITQFSFSPDGCFGTLLADKLQRKCDILNRGFSGYNSRWNLLMLPRLINKDIAKELVAVTIFLGANDSVIKDLNPKQHVPIEEYKSNISKIVEYFNSVGVDRSRIIMIGPPPCHEDAWRKVCEKDGKVFSKCHATTGRYSAVCAEAATESGVEYVELYNSMTTEQDWHSFFNDGLHFSSRGARFLFDKLWPCIESRTSHLPNLLMPYWADVDYNKPANSLLN